MVSGLVVSSIKMQYISGEAYISRSFIFLPLMFFSLLETDSLYSLKLRTNTSCAASTSSVVAACSKIAVARSSDPRAQAAHHRPFGSMLNNNSHEK